MGLVPDAQLTVTTKRTYPFDKLFASCLAYRVRDFLPC